MKGKPDKQAGAQSGVLTDPMDDILAAEARRVSFVRMQMLQMHPFWGYLLLQMKLVPAPSLESFAATDCLRHIWYNPFFTSHLSMAQLGFVLAHEVGHQIFASEDRRRGRSHYLWNCATDFAINRIVAEIENPARPGSPLYESPDGDIPGLGTVRILLDARWRGMIAEAIYEYLAAESLVPPVSITIHLSGADGEGFCVPNLTDHGGGIDIHLPENLSSEQRQELFDRLAGALETWQRQDGAGNIPGNLVREILDRGRPSVPWQRVFRQFAGQAVAKDDYSLCHPNKRYMEHDLLVPGLYSEKVGQVVVSLDTSGSMTEADLQAVAVELNALQAQAVDLTLIVADAQIQQVVGPDSIERFLKARKFRGGGGTDHRPVFDWIRDARLRPDLFVGLTDLQTCLPDRRPPFPVLWVVPAASRATAPWGRVIRVNT
ncbi:MAG TPA: VWA-like domain-containing protein [Myxococcota bacterium]|nr:VWA-like domain-containing protein [Myxococcota bacterium]HOH76574.1 VWA-like domain-containing protein [Myxococcota bacterium]HPV04972.1 VWA-like domain-containing protein [Myxococcota bacterium]